MAHRAPPHNRSQHNNSSTPAIIHIRPMCGGDLRDVWRIERQSFSAQSTWGIAEAELERPDMRHVVATISQAGASSEDTFLAGYAICWVSEDEIHISTLAVEPQFRRCGIGTRLVLHLLTEAQRSGA